MKKRFLILLICALTVILPSCGETSTPVVFEPYTDFDGTDPTAHVQLDEGITLDGVLNEQIWKESKTAINIPGATKDQTTKETIDVKIFGQRSATVYTYIGENAVYFAFDVKDKNLYYNESQAQGASTCVELYFTSSSKTALSRGCYSVRVNPTGKEGDEAVNVGIYIPNAAGNAWDSTSMRGKVDAAVKVDGKVKNSANDRLYTTENNKGYVMEIAIDKSLIGDNASAVRFAAAFVQDQGFDQTRLNNTFISGNHYLKPSTWVLMSNNGKVSG